MMEHELFKMFMALKILVASVLLVLLAASVWPFGSVRRNDPNKIWRKRDRELYALMDSLCPDQRKVIDISSSVERFPLKVTQVFRFRGIDLTVTFILNQKEASIDIRTDSHVNVLPIKTNLGLIFAFDYLIHTYQDEYTSEQLYELQRMLFNWKVRLNKD